MRSLWISTFCSIALLSACATLPPKPPVPCLSADCTQAQLNLTVIGPTGLTVSLVPDLFPALGATNPSPTRYSIIVPSEDRGTGATVVVQAPGYLDSRLRLHLLQPNGECQEVALPATGAWEICPAVHLQPLLPPPLTRDERLNVHESFQGAVLHTQQFGDLNWYPPAFISLSDADRASYYDQAANWGDTDITVAVRWDYGEPGQPYGTGQLVPPRDLTGDGATLRALVREVFQHPRADGKPFVPVVYLNCDLGVDDCLTITIPTTVAALSPTTGDTVDFANDYVKWRICYDSCIPGYQPPGDVDRVVLALRAAVPRGVIGIEFATGYSFWGPAEGAEQFGTPAGQALDEVSWEGNSWPSDNLNQYWGILDRWLGPCFVRPSAMPPDFDPGAPFQAGDAKWYLRMGTPRGPFHVDILEPFTYQWVRGQVVASQVPVNLAFIRSMIASDCAASVSIDLPQ